MIKKDEVISFAWQHILLLVSLYVMTFGVAACVRSQLGSSVISTIPYVMASAGTILDYIPQWTDYRRLHHHDERHLRGAANSDSEKKLRVGATLPARHRLFLRNAHRPQHGAYGVDGF